MFRLTGGYLLSSHPKLNNPSKVPSKTLERLQFHQCSNMCVRVCVRTSAAGTKRKVKLSLALLFF